MGKSDIIASLKLNSTDYEQKLAKAKDSTRKFSKDGGQGLEGMVGKFKGLAVAVAGSKAVMETFNAVIKSSQTIGDAYTIAISQARGSVDELVYAMANADFSGFNNGLRGIMANAKEAAAAMDALGNAQISYDYLTAGYRSSFKTNIATAKDKSLSSAERDAAYNAAMGSLSSMEMAVTGYTDKIVKAVVDNAVAKANNINRDYVTRENIDRIMELDLMPGGDEEKARLKAIYDQYKDIREQQMAYQREAKKYADQLANGEQYTRNPLTGNMELNIYKAARIQRRRDEAQAEADRLNAMVATNAEYQQAALFNAMLVKGTDEWLKEMTSLIIKADNAKGSLAEMRTATYEVANALGVAAQEAAKLDADALRMRNFKPKSVSMSGLPSAYITEDLSGQIDLDVPMVIPATTEGLADMTDKATNAADAFGALGSTMSNLTSLVGEDAASWLDWGAGVAQAVAQAIPAIAAITTAKTAEATANTAAAATGAASSQASIPIVGPVLAVAAVASVLASLANLPKFATGGVVPGNMMSGDNVLIRANSGEVVLTKQMAGNIGDALKGGLAGKVEFRIKGDTLVGVLNSHNKIASRNYGG